MERAHLDPFIARAEHVLAIRVEVADHDASGTIASDAEVLASIGISGPAPGTLTAAFPRSTAVRIASLFAGRPIPPEADDEIADALGEILDIIAGRACDAPHHRTTPTVTIRHGLLGARMPDAGTRRIACLCAAGEFSLAFRPAPPEVGRVSPASADPAIARQR